MKDLTHYIAQIANCNTINRSAIDVLVSGICERDEEIVRLRARLRTTAQTLIAEIGASGPQNAEEAATRAVEEIAKLRDACETLLVYVRDKCDDSVSPAWCCNHQMKQCTGAADVAKVRELLAPKKPTEETR